MTHLLLEPTEQLHVATMPDTNYCCTSVQRSRRCIDLYQLASFHRPDFSPASVTCDREQDKIRSKFSSHSTTVCVVICFVWPSGEGLASGYFIKAYIGIPLRCHTSRSVLDRLPHCSRLYLTLQTDFFFPHRSLVRSAQHNEYGGTFCTKGRQFALGQNVRGDIVP